MPKDTGKKLADMLYGQNPEQAAFGVFPQMKGRRSKQDPEAAKNVPVDLMRGAVSGVLGAPGDLESLIRMLPGLDESRTILPTSEEIEGRLPLKSDTPVSRAATGLGQLGGGFYTGPGSPFKLAGALPSAARKAGMDFAVAAGESGPKIFVGPKAKTWDKGRAAMAEAMEESGRSPEDIWLATGTFRGRDGILRQEIDDRAARFLTDDQRKEIVEGLKGQVGELREQVKPTKQKDLFPKALTEARKEVKTKIGELKEEIQARGKNPSTQGLEAKYIFEHPELYKAYPELGEINITTGGGGGGDTLGALSVIPRSGDKPGVMDMDIYTPGLKRDPTSISLHEMQHAVQTLEGMGPGGSPTMAFNQPEAFEILKRLREEQIKPAPFFRFQQANKFPEDIAEQEYQKYLKEFYENPIINPKIDRELQSRAAMEYYKRLAGEAEARAVQDRQLMTPSQRMETPPPASYDVPQEDLIVKPPREYADGGRVHISDSPDVMQLELAAGGGVLSKLAKLARAPAKTKQEIEAIAERMAPQVTGEYVRKKPGSAITVADKTKKQFEREKNLPVDVRAISEERIPQPVDIEKLKGEVMIGIPGDPTVTGKTLHGVGDVRLESPAPQHGGPLYGLYHDDDHFWASGLGAARRVQNLAKEAGEQYDAPVIGKYIMMGPESINYAQHFADANLQAIDLSKMTKRQIEGFNKIIRQGSPASGPRPSFPGIEDKESAYLHMAMDPELRKHFNALMQQNTVTEAFNLPSGQDIRYAITEGPLRDLETGVTGYSMGRMRPDIPSGELKFSEHPTYSHDIPGHFLGQTKYPVPYELSFPDTLKSIRENPKQAGHEFGSLKMVGPRQTIDQQLIDELKMYEERMKALTGKKAGGAVSYAEGGEITADDLILEERKL